MSEGDKACRVQVVVRVRPVLPHELNSEVAVTCSSEGTRVQVNTPVKTEDKKQIPGSQRSGARAYDFDACLNGSATQHDLFETCGMSELVDAALDGYSVTVFAFGQTGSGKTHTMIGPRLSRAAEGAAPSAASANTSTSGSVASEDGMLARCVTHAYQSMESRKEEAEFSVSLTCLELYNETVSDLLGKDKAKPLQVRQDQRDGFQVVGLNQVACPSEPAAITQLSRALKHRHTRSHKLNNYSSRSHCLITFVFASKEKGVTSGGEAKPQGAAGGVRRFGKLVLVDLAGSERLKDTGNTDRDAVRETGSINKSLFTLGQVLAALSTRTGSGPSFVPYRDSKLTQLLWDGLRGNGRSLMLACLGPTSTYADESLNTLHFASMALRIKSEPVMLLDPLDQLVLDLRNTIRSLQTENRQLAASLQLLSSGADVETVVGMMPQHLRASESDRPWSSADSASSPITPPRGAGHASHSKSNKSDILKVQASPSPSPSRGNTSTPPGQPSLKRNSLGSSTQANSLASTVPNGGRRDHTSSTRPVTQPAPSQPRSRSVGSLGRPKIGSPSPAKLGRNSLRSGGDLSQGGLLGVGEVGRNGALVAKSLSRDKTGPQVRNSLTNSQLPLRSPGGGGRNSRALSPTRLPSHAVSASLPAPPLPKALPAPTANDFPELDALEAEFQAMLGSLASGKPAPPLSAPPPAPPRPATETVRSSGYGPPSGGAKASIPAAGKKGSGSGAEPKEAEPKAVNWATQNPWFGADMEMTQYAYQVHDILVDAKGMDPSADEYFNELEKQVSERFPEKWAKRSIFSSFSNALAVSKAGDNFRVSSSRLPPCSCAATAPSPQKDEHGNEYTMFSTVGVLHNLNAGKKHASAPAAAASAGGQHGPPTGASARQAWEQRINRSPAVASSASQAPHCGARQISAPETPETASASGSGLEAIQMLRTSSSAGNHSSLTNAAPPLASSTGLLHQPPPLASSRQNERTTRRGGGARDVSDRLTSYSVGSQAVKSLASPILTSSPPQAHSRPDTSTSTSNHDPASSALNPFNLAHAPGAAPPKASKRSGGKTGGAGRAMVDPFRSDMSADAMQKEYIRQRNAVMEELRRAKDDAEEERRKIMAKINKVISSSRWRTK